MKIIKKVATVVVSAVLATGIVAGTTGTADAAPRSHNNAKVTYFWDTGWG